MNGFRLCLLRWGGRLEEGNDADWFGRQEAPERLGLHITGNGNEHRADEISFRVA
jgi:hypothetical protein